ncbi:MAG: ribonuclease P protein component [Muribaculum sp.]
MTSYRLYKREKLRSVTSIDALFSRTPGIAGVMAFPIRAVWKLDDTRAGGSRFLVSVPKKRLRHAVDRVAMRRRVREAYRLNRSLLPDTTTLPLDIVFIFVADTLQPYRRIEDAVKKILSRVSDTLPKTTEADDAPSAD